MGANDIFGIMYDILPVCRTNTNHSSDFIYESLTLLIFTDFVFLSIQKKIKKIKIPHIHAVQATVLV